MGNTRRSCQSIGTFAKASGIGNCNHNKTFFDPTTFSGYYFYLFLIDYENRNWNFRSLNSMQFCFVWHILIVRFVTCYLFHSCASFRFVDLYIWRWRNGNDWILDVFGIECIQMPLFLLIFSQIFQRELFFLFDSNLLGDHWQRGRLG